MSKITHVVIEGYLYDVQTPTTDTLSQFVKDVPRYKLEDVLNNPSYKSIKKGNKAPV